MTVTLSAQDLRELIAAVPDPEVPVLSIEDLGILRDIDVDAESGRIVVTITPTYSGCPAVDAIRADIMRVLADHGVDDAEVRTVLSPAWSTDWMSVEGKRKLEEYGIAPPSGKSTMNEGPIPLTLSVKCPLCGSLNTEELTRFGSTACKALYRCRACREPFDYFKVH
ncbi:phenylacetate-CoA oxygenase subunit PaaJ [Saxibacter everestensis]|uniref:Phenylacetate-CoA oxygenase subunit PaaJ n=1 Tax=Saxibacter everestensis TaxID=2909229 RepID=A0ABY8QQ94_9MICO|nr:phenylacetate-CoA oxygenase subunit PaaJ [Brevibacteriaceae bacterium ZFBP1038]